MLLDFSVDWRWTIGGTDVSPHVETWELAREQPDMGTPAWWRGKLVLRPVVGRNLNLDPLANSLWRQGTSCSLTVAGYQVFTGSILLAYYDDWSTAPRLELEVGDILAAKNHRQVIPFGEYNALSLLQTLRIPGLAPAGKKLEINTDLTSPVKVLQELTWVIWLKERGVPATLFTRSNGQVSYDSPQVFVSITRTLEQVADFTRQRPALEIPGSVIASASLNYLVPLPELTSEETEEEIDEETEERDDEETEEGDNEETDRETDRGADRGIVRGTSARGTVLISKQGETIKITYLDSLGRPTREEIYNSNNNKPEGFAVYQYSSSGMSYKVVKKAYIWDDSLGFLPYEHMTEEGKIKERRISTGFLRGPGMRFLRRKRVVAQKKITVYWPEYRIFSSLPRNRTGLCLAYLIEEYQISQTRFSRFFPPHLVRLTTRAKGTTQDSDTLEEAKTLFPTLTEIIPNQEIQFPSWAKPPEKEEPPEVEQPPQTEEPPEERPPEEELPEEESPQTEKPPKFERVTDVVSEEVVVEGFTGPPVYVNIPWLSITVNEQLGSRDLEQRIESLRQELRRTLRAAARWMATEIVGRAFARRIKMPPSSEWLGNPRPWTLAQIGNEVFWLVGETLRGTDQGVEFEATGILAGRPNTIPPGEFPPGMFPPGTLPPDTSSSGLFPPGTIPSFIPLITVAPTRFPKVGIGCVMEVGEVVTVPGDPWLGMAVEIGYEVSEPVNTSAMVGIGVGELTEAWLGLAADATYEVEGGEDDEDDEDDSGDEVGGLTLEAEDGVIYGGSIIYDTEASSCYAVGGEPPSIDFIVDSTSINWARPLRLRVVYKATEEGEIYVYVLRQGLGFLLVTFLVFPTTGYDAVNFAIPVSEEPFEGIGVDATSGIRLDAIQLAPATGDWPPLNPCPD